MARPVVVSSERMACKDSAEAWMIPKVVIGWQDQPAACNYMAADVTPTSRLLLWLPLVLCRCAASLSGARKGVCISRTVGAPAGKKRCSCSTFSMDTMGTRALSKGEGRGVASKPRCCAVSLCRTPGQTLLLSDALQSQQRA